MKAITTKYIPCSSTRPSRIAAFDCDNNRVVITHSGGVGVMPYALAARFLCAKMGWTGTLAAGAVKGGNYVFTFVDVDSVMHVCKDGQATLPRSA